MKAHRVTISDALRLDLHAAGDQLIAQEHRCDTIRHTVAGVLDVVREERFIGQHFQIHTACAGDKILLVGVLTGEAERDQVTAVEEVLVRDQVIVTDSVPARRLDGADAAALLGWHQRAVKHGRRRAAASERVQLSVMLERRSG